jgi:hypothetical protein
VESAFEKRRPYRSVAIRFYGRLKACAAHGV